MDIVTIVVSVIIAIIMIAVSFYLYTMYCHRNISQYHSVGQRNRYSNWIKDCSCFLSISSMGTTTFDTH